MIDSHCHLDLPAFKDDVDDVIARSEKAGVVRFLVPGTTPKGWQRQSVLRQRYPQVDIAFGLHPYFDTSMQTKSLDALNEWLYDAHKDAVAIGEIGLDATVSTPIKTQQYIFTQQLQLAKEYQLPVILHHRKTHHLLHASLKQENFEGGGIIHAFSGSQQEAEKYIERGFLLGVGGTITYDRATKTRRVLASVPLSSLVLETDSPDMPIAGYQGQRNTPERLLDITNTLASLLDTGPEQIIQQTTDNYHRLFVRR